MKEQKHNPMSKPTGLLALPFFTILALSTTWADQVVLKNGDRVTGSIIKKDGKNLTIKTDQFGVVTTPWDQVESIKADKPVNLVLQDGKTGPARCLHHSGR